MHPRADHGLEQLAQPRLQRQTQIGKIAQALMLTEAFGLPGFDEEKFLRGASEMLDGVKAFWDGLWQDRS